MAASSVTVTGRYIWLHLKSGRTIELPIAKFPRLAAAPTHKLKRVVLLRGGATLRWAALDEDIKVETVVKGNRDMRGARRPHSARKRLRRNPLILYVSLPDDLLLKLDSIAAARRISRSTFINEALDRYLTRISGPAAKKRSLAPTTTPGRVPAVGVRIVPPQLQHQSSTINRNPRARRLSHAGRATTTEGRTKLLTAEGGCVTLAEAGALLRPHKPVSSQTIYGKLLAHKLIGYPSSRGDIAVPVWQFKKEGGMIDGLPAILKVIHQRVPGADNITPFAFLLQHNSLTGGRIPLDLLREGKVDVVMVAVEAYAH